jgi:hypothetical protein
MAVEPVTFKLLGIKVEDNCVYLLGRNGENVYELFDAKKIRWFFDNTIDKALVKIKHRNSVDCEAIEIHGNLQDLCSLLKGLGFSTIDAS